MSVLTNWSCTAKLKKAKTLFQIFQNKQHASFNRSPLKFGIVFKK